MRFIIVFLTIFLLICNAFAMFYDAFRGEPITMEEVKRHEEDNTLLCIIDVEPCDPNEGRRIDGTCNNLRYPTRGAGYTPLLRVLPAVYDKDYEPRKAASGDALPLARHLRTSLLPEGRVPNQKLTQLVTHFLGFMFGDIMSQHDTLNYLLRKPYCCADEGKTDYDCTPIKIPEDDPVFRFSSIRCLSMTRPQTFQSIGCIPNGTTPERINSVTPVFDLSLLYGESEKILNEKFRTFNGGLLKYDVLNGQIWPPAADPAASVCFLNKQPFETRCHDLPDVSANILVGANLILMWFYRHHNFIAEELAKVNPCWDDKKLFDTARDINIAIAMQIFYYEIGSHMLGRENLERSGVLSRYPGFRDLYNPNVIPQVSLEYPYILRWIHTLQEGSLKMYDTDGHYMKQVPIVNMTTRTGYLALDDNLVYLTQGSFRQGCAANDHIVDPDIANNGLGGLQQAADITANDVSKTRYFGFPPYVDYIELCFGKPIRNWEDLKYIMDPERVEMARNSYDNIRDMDLIAGLWLENCIDDGIVPPTFYCIVVDQLIRNIVSDRHWYENPHRPNAFTYPQLIEIRKSTIARILCDVGDSVSHIQRAAFLRISPTNKLVHCSKIRKIDYSMWKDPTCDPVC